MDKISIFNANINNFRKCFADGARKYKDVAETMVFEQGLRGNVDNKFVRKIMKDHFDSTGKLTPKGVENIKNVIGFMFNGKKQDCSITEFFNNLYKQISKV